MPVHWKNKAIEDKDWSYELEQQKSFKKLIALHAFMLILIALLTGRLVFASVTPSNVILATADGARVMLNSSDSPLAFSRDEFLEYAKTIIQLSLTRNESSIAEESLRPYVTEPFLRDLGLVFSDSVERGYFQSYVIERIRIDREFARQINLRVQGQFRSGSIDFFQNPTYTFEVSFALNELPDVGHAQWKANQIAWIPNIEYDPQEVIRSIREQTQ